MDTDSKKFFATLAGAVSDEPREISELSGEQEGQLTIDVYQTHDAIVVESPIAGVKGDDIDVNITSESVTIRGRRERVHEVKEDDFFYQECYWGSFSRSIILPEEVNADKSEATIKNGVLRVVMPKVAQHKGKKLRVKND